MNILVIGKFYTEGFALHIAETLSAMGHAVRRFEPGVATGRLGGRLGHRLDQVRSLVHEATDGLPAVRSWHIRTLWQAADDGPLDLALVCHDFLWPAEVAKLKRRTGAAVAMWFPDAMVNFRRGFFMNAPYDGLFFKDPYIVAMLSDVLRSPVYYLPECFNPQQHRAPGAYPSGDSEYACDVTTAGNLHAYRVAVFQHLADWNVKLWGSPAPLWMPPSVVLDMAQGRPVVGLGKARAFRAAKIVVNNLHYSEVWGLNARTFEAAGIGAFQLVDWRPGLDQLFVDGKELVSFRGIHDLQRKVAEWLPRDQERQVIGAAAARRALAEHTYEHRLSLLLNTIAGRATGFALPNIRMELGEELAR